MQYLPIILSLTLACAYPNLVRAEEPTFDISKYTPDAQGKYPGDKGYMHEEVHPFYQLLFASGKCYCHTGECRPTKWRASRDSPSGIQVVHNRKWIDVPKQALKQRQEVPPELWSYEAHICAFATASGMNVECAIINSGL